MAIHNINGHAVSNRSKTANIRKLDVTMPCIAMCREVTLTYILGFLLLTVHKLQHFYIRSYYSRI